MADVVELELGLRRQAHACGELVLEALRLEVAPAGPR
jgi:hypothetical protein